MFLVIWILNLFIVPPAHSNDERYVFLNIVLDPITGDVMNSVPLTRRVTRYQRGNQNPYIEEEQTTQWPKEKVQKDKQWAIKHTYKTKDRVTRTPVKIGGKLRCALRL